RWAGMGLCITALASFHGSAHHAESVVAAAAETQPQPQRVLYRDRADFERKVAKLTSDGRDKLQVITDFDFTLSKVCGGCWIVLCFGGVIGYATRACVFVVVSFG